MEDQPSKDQQFDEQADDFDSVIQEGDSTSDEGIVKNIDELKELIADNHPDVQAEDLL